MLAHLTSASEAATTDLARLERAALHTRAYLNHLAPASESPPADQSTAVPPGQVESLRRELPPPIKATDKGRKTHGRWIGPDGVVHEIISGQDENSRLVDQQLKLARMPGRTARASDAEMKLAAHMAEYGIKHVTVIINHSPCKGPFGCDTLVPILLPAGSTLTVHGVTEQGIRLVKRYTGGAKPWWR